MVRVAVKPSLRLASCCMVLVINGGAGTRRRLPRETAATVKASPFTSARMASASAFVFTSSFLPSLSARRAVNFLACPGGHSTASMFQYSSGLKASISFSLSTMRRTATLCTRPAESPRRTLRHKNGLSL